MRPLVRSLFARWLLVHGFVLLACAGCDADSTVSAADFPDAGSTSDAQVVETAAPDAAVDAATDAVEVDAVADIAAPDVPDVFSCPDGMVAADGAVDATACVAVAPPCTPTAETCNGIDDDCNGLTDDGTCSDGNPCTIGDACGPASCLPGAVTDCTDGNPCTLDNCDPKKGCSHLAFLGPCNDGDACTEGDVCKVVSGVVTCVGATASCHDDNACTVDTCVAATGCIHTPAPFNSACDDQNACTTGDLCDHDGNCVGIVVACDDSNPCTVDLCDAKGACQFAPGDGQVCADDDLCTVGDACILGVCVPGALAVCSDDNPCTVDSCGSATGACVFSAIAASCSDGDPCTVGDACAAGQCASGVKTVCNDGASCTDDACDPKTGACVFVPVHDGLACDDSAACTVGDACQNGACISGAPPVCDDGNVCTSDDCDTATGACVFIGLDGTACDDGDSCTAPDVCTAGQCSAGKSVCQCKKLADCAIQEDGDLCNGTLWCDLTDHTCKLDLATVIVCDTSKDTTCLQYVCNKATGLCDAQNLNEGGKCNANSTVCASGDHCQAGICISGGVPTCDDDNACTNDSCDPQNGCQFVANSLACSDGDACTLDDHCANSACVPGIAKFCDDGNACSTDS